MKRKHGQHQFAVCIKNKGYPAALELRKIYQVIPDASADEMDQLRVIDESGEDYFYPKDFFLVVELPQTVSAVLEKLAS
jgi:hypothetical protein